MGLFGCILPTDYGGGGLDYVSYAVILRGIVARLDESGGHPHSHLMMALMTCWYGTEAQKQTYVPAFATGERRGGLMLTEANAGSDAAAMQTTAIRQGDVYVVNGSKMFITNAERGNTFMLLAKTDPRGSRNTGASAPSCWTRAAPAFESGGPQEAGLQGPAHL